MLPVGSALPPEDQILLFCGVPLSKRPGSSKWTRFLALASGDADALTKAGWRRSVPPGADAQRAVMTESGHMWCHMVGLAKTFFCSPEFRSPAVSVRRLGGGVIAHQRRFLQ